MHVCLRLKESWWGERTNENCIAISLCARGGSGSVRREESVLIWCKYLSSSSSSSQGTFYRVFEFFVMMIENIFSFLSSCFILEVRLIICFLLLRFVYEFLMYYIVGLLCVCIWCSVYIDGNIKRIFCFYFLFFFFELDSSYNLLCEVHFLYWINFVHMKKFFLEICGKISSIVFLYKSYVELS